MELPSCYVGIVRVDMEEKRDRNGRRRRGELVALYESFATRDFRRRNEEWNWGREEKRRREGLVSPPSDPPPSQAVAAWAVMRLDADANARERSDPWSQLKLGRSRHKAIGNPDEIPRCFLSAHPIDVSNSLQRMMGRQIQGRATVSHHPLKSLLGCLPAFYFHSPNS